MDERHKAFNALYNIIRTVSFIIDILLYQKYIGFVFINDNDAYILFI